MPRFITETPVWTWMTLSGLAILAAIDWMRRSGLAGESVVVGSLPNAVAVPVLTYGSLMILYPRRRHAPKLGRSFAIALLGVSLTVVAWEYLQLTGNLVFDPADLIATALGVLLALALFPLAARHGTDPEEAES